VVNVEDFFILFVVMSGEFDKFKMIAFAIIMVTNSDNFTANSTCKPNSFDVQRVEAY